MALKNVHIFEIRLFSLFTKKKLLSIFSSFHSDFVYRKVFEIDPIESRFASADAIGKRRDVQLGSDHPAALDD